MTRFQNLLTEINAKLELPQPLKSRIIWEIADDIEETFKAYIKRGLSEEDAETKTKDKFTLSETAIIELTQIHLTPYRRWLDKFSRGAQSKWEKFLLIIIFTLILSSLAKVVYSTPFFVNASYFIYPILTALLFATILFIVKFYQLYIKKDHHIKKLRNGLDWILYSCGMILFLGVFGYFGELYVSSQSVNYLGPFFFLSFLSNSTSLHLSVEWLVRNSSMMMTCLGSLMITLLYWFMLINKAGKIEQAEASILLDI